jgi:AcrR family transcriptional regulator
MEDNIVMSKGVDAQAASPLALDDLLNLDVADPKALHEKAAELTRHKILLAAMECFAEKGFQKASIREIAAKAGVTLGAVYHHFKDKKELLMRLNRLRQVKSNQLLESALKEDEDFFEALRAALEGQFHFLASDPLLRGLTREYMSMALVDADFRAMHTQADHEYEEIVSAPLMRRYPQLSDARRTLLIQMLFVSFEGLIIALAADSPVVSQPENILNGIVNAFRHEVENMDEPKAMIKRKKKAARRK